MVRARRLPPAVFCCPACARPLELRGDMWGPYWECDECGFAAEDDDLVCRRGTDERRRPPPDHARRPGE